MARDNWLRVVTYGKTTDDPDAFGKYLENRFQSVVATLGNTPGHRRGYWVEDPTTGTMAAITYWMRREAIDEAGTVLANLRSEGERFGIKMLSQNNFMIRKLIRGHNLWGEGNEASVRVVMYENTSGDPEALSAYLGGPAFQNVERIFGGIQGYRRGYWAVDPATDQMAVITYWTGPEVIQEARSALAELRQKAAANYGVKMVSENNFMLKRACELD